MSDIFVEMTPARVISEPDPKKVVILLHGSRSKGDEMVWIAENWKKNLPDAVFLLPKAATPDPDAPGLYSWYFGDTPENQQATLSLAAAEINTIIDGAIADYGVPASCVALAGYSQGMTLAFEASRLRKIPVGLVIGFCGTLPPEIDKSASEQRPEVMLIHGERDDAVEFSELTFSEGRLRHLGYSAFTLPVPGVGHWVDQFGAYEASRFLRQKLDMTAPTEVVFDEIKKKVKILIWDLDDTLWAGTLAEGDDVKLHSKRAELVRRLNGHGLVSSICSKNDHATARQKLVEFGMWDEFVFPRIDFHPKGAVVRDLLEEMQLRAANSVFIDDNTLNLEEVRAACPGILCLDARSLDCDAKLEAIHEAHRHVTKNRLQDYKALEAKALDRKNAKDDPTDFLRSCNIRVSVAWRADILDYSKRIEELINRTNQLNFTKSRVAEGAMDVFLSEPMLRESFAIFVWDKYGYHGLVGFVGVDISNQRLMHMTFSCRIMHMGIEEWALAKVMDRFPNLQLPTNFPINPAKSDWIREEQYTDPTIRQFIFSNEKKGSANPDSVEIRVMANCQSGALAHFSHLRDRAEIDNFPRTFNMFHMLNGQHQKQSFPKFLIYGIYIDYYSDVWPENMRSRIDTGLYEEAAEAFVRMAHEKDSRILAIPTPTGIPERGFHPHLGATPERAALFTNVWKRFAEHYDHVDLLPIEDLCRGDQMLDVAHFSIDVTRAIASYIRAWFEEKRSTA